MKNVRLNNGIMMPAIGFGIFQIPENETERIVNDVLFISFSFARIKEKENTL